MDAGVSCNACLMASFSTKKSIKDFKQRLFALRPGLLKSLEIENITLFPKVAERLTKNNLMPETARVAGKVRTIAAKQI